MHSIASVSTEFKGAVTIHHNETKCVITFKQLVEDSLCELVITQVQGGVNRFMKGSKSMLSFFFFSVNSRYSTAVNHKTIGRDLIVELKPLHSG